MWLVGGWFHWNLQIVVFVFTVVCMADVVWRFLMVRFSLCTKVHVLLIKVMGVCCGCSGDAFDDG